MTDLTIYGEGRGQDPASPFPLYMSPSQISSLLTCGEQFRLTRKLHVPSRPMWAGIGGGAVHRMTEDYDRYGETKSWEFYWDEALTKELETHPGFDPEEYYRSGRVSKANPDKEGPEWWAVNGPKFVRAWISWRSFSELEIWEYPDSDGVLQPAIELEVWANGDTVRCFIDRVMVEPESGALHIVDLKTGSMTDAWPLQMIINNLCLSDALGIRADYAGFWKARSGGVEKWHGLEKYTDEWTREQVGKARLMRDLELFVAHPNSLCNAACGVRAYCLAVGGTPPTLEQDATPAHNTKGSK